jgi:hypothetical protein
MGHNVLLPHWQEPGIGPHPKPDESSPYSDTVGVACDHLLSGFPFTILYAFLISRVCLSHPSWFLHPNNILWRSHALSTLFCRIRGFLGCCTVWCGGWISTFRNEKRKKHELSLHRHENRKSLILIMQFSPTTCYFLDLRFTCSPQHSLFSNTVNLCSYLSGRERDRESFAPI